MDLEVFDPKEFIAEAGLSQEEMESIYDLLTSVLKKDRFSKFIVVLSFVTVIAFTTAVMIFSWYDKKVPDSLIYSFFGMFSVELSALAWRTKDLVKKVASNKAPGY